MHAKLEEYLQKKYKERWEIREKEKKELLIKEGLYELVPLSGNVKIDNWDEYEERWSEEKSEYVYYKRVPIQVTDEEYKRIKEVCKQHEEQEEKQGNGVASAIVVIAWCVYIVGFIVGIINGAGQKIDFYDGDVEATFYWATALLSWAEFFVYGTLLLGFAEIIKLLDQIKRKK